MKPNESQKQWLRIVIPLALGLISFFILARIFTSSSFTSMYTDYLDTKRNLVLEMTGASAASSAVVSMLPGDAATPIAEKLADLSGYTLIVLCAIFIEKYLISLAGVAAFKYLIPAGCILYIISQFVHNPEIYKSVSRKLIIFGIVFFCTIPVSIKASQYIETRYEDSITENIEAANASTEELQGISEDEEESSNILSSIVDSVTGNVEEKVDEFETILTNFIESIAIMIVTSCLIPIAVLVFFVWIAKLIFQLDIHLPQTK